jgi:lipid-A-disaccharide synthase
VKTLMLVCGEPSGDQLGAQLMAAIKKLAGDHVRIVGVGGPAMTREGLTSLYSLDATAVMGLREVVPAIPRILARVRRAADYAVSIHPDALVVIDSPDFTHRIARAVKKRDPTIKTVNYVAPQVWASRAYRAKAMARYFDLILALFPFEVPFFRTYGLKAAFVGHPVIERRAKMTGGDRFRDGCAVAGAFARQPHQRNPIHFSDFPRGGDIAGREDSWIGHGPAHGSACGGQGAGRRQGLAHVTPHFGKRGGQVCRL